MMMMDSSTRIYNYQPQSYDENGQKYRNYRKLFIKSIDIDDNYNNNDNVNESMSIIINNNNNNNNNNPELSKNLIFNSNNNDNCNCNYDYYEYYNEKLQLSNTFRSSSLSSASTGKSSLFLILLAIIISPFTYVNSLNRLNDHIIHYETLDYDPQPHLNILHRSRRAANLNDDNNNNYNENIQDPLFIYNFHSHGRNFSLKLKRDIDSVFHRDLIIEDGDGQPLTINLDHLVSGHLSDQPNSRAYGSIRDGIFVGKIHSTVPDEDTFYVENANKYFHLNPVDIYLLDGTKKQTKYNYPEIIKAISLSKTTSASTSKRIIPSLPFHSVIYSSKNVIDPFHDRRSPNDGSCGANAKVREWMDTIANSAVVDNDNDDDDDEDEDEIEMNNNNNHHHNLSFNIRYNNNNNESLTNDPNRPIIRSKRAFYSISNHNNNNNRNYDHGNNYRRLFEAQGRISYNRPPSPHQTPYLPSRRACSLYIQTDTFLWDHVKKHETEKSDFKVREEIASLVAQHIKAVNHIYETSVFKNIMGLKFIVQRLRINDSSACEPRKREFNQFCSPNIDVSNFLNLNSQFNHNDFCLAYIFTYRDFSGGTLGLAWVASTSGASGGICEKYKTYTENIGGRQVQTKRSLNTGIITFVNYNSRVPPKVSELTLAHEIGHNFGSPHDYPAECRPGGPLGNYIMYSSATSGERQNNNKFSHCSVNNISTVLNAVFNNEGKENCFQEDNGPFCGNKIVEEGEECDCGYDSRECNEDCCYPRNVDEFKHRDPHAQPCRRRPYAYCSPSEGPCCTEKCTFEGSMKQCRDDDECTYKSFCNGKRPQCPLPPAKPNKTECNMGTQVCWHGSCTGSICQKYDLEECFLTTRRGAKPEEMCEVACQQVNQPKTCRRTSEIDIMRNISGMKLRPGSPCNDFQGYCDVFQRCRPVDAEGPLARLKNLLFNKKTLISIKQWVTTYWWACMLMLFAAILFMAAFIKCCAVHTPSSNPKLAKALRISDTLRRPADTLRRKSRERSQHQHQQSSSGGGGGGHRQNRGERNRDRNSNHAQNRSSGANRQNGPTRSNQPSSSSSNANQPSQSYQQLQQQQSANITQSSNIDTTFPPTLVVNLPPPAPKEAIIEPPPPYPGLSNKPSAPPLNIVVPGIPGAPSHGYGEGRGHYNRQQQQQNSNIPSSSSSSAQSANKGQKDRGKETNKNNKR